MIDLDHQSAVQPPKQKKAQECRQERKGSIATNQILLRAEKKNTTLKGGHAKLK